MRIWLKDHFLIDYRIFQNKLFNIRRGNPGNSNDFRNICMKILLIYEVLVTLAQNLLQNFKFKEQVNYL